MDNANNTTAPDLRTSFEDLGDEYALAYVGREFEPEFSDGDQLVFSTTSRHKTGDVVALWLRPESMRGRPQASIWKVATALGCSLPYKPHPESEVHPVLIIQSAVDGKCRAIRAEDILAVHPKIGVFYDMGVTYDISEGEVA